MKAGTRLVANHSPEPFSNIALSVAEDVAVLGGLALIQHDPVLALIVFSIVLLAIAYFGPKLFRLVRANLWLLARKFASLGGQENARLTNALPVELEAFFDAIHPEAGEIVWAAPCLCSSARGFAGNTFGYLVATDDQDAVWFVAKRFFRSVAAPFDVAGCKVGAERKLLGEQVILCAKGAKPACRLTFDAARRDLAHTIVAALKQRLAAPAPARQPELAAA